MDPDFSGGGEQNFEFAYNSIHFSDRVLRIEIVADPPKRKAEAQLRGSEGRKDDALMDIVTENNECEPEQISIDQADSIYAAAYESNDGDGTDDEVACATDTNCNSEPSPVLRVESVCISSAILAAKSPFFYKLFSNGMQESDQRHATLRLHESEEAAFMDLLNYMYSNKLSTNSASGLLDVLMAADKFEVSSCVRHCCELLCNLPMTLESALLYLELPVSISMAFATQSLTDAVKKFLATHFRDITKFQEEIMHLPLAGFEAIISSDDIQVASEDALYDLVIKWTRFRYPKAEERWHVVDSLLDRYIRLPHMSCRKLRKVLAYNDVDHELASKAVLDALFFKAETSHQQRVLATEDPRNHRFTERAYKYRPVKIVNFESPYQQCIVYLDLKREECADLFPSGRVYSQAFHLGGQGFFFSAHCNTDQQSLFNCFGLFLGMQEKGSVSMMVDYEFAVRIKPSCDFTSKYKGSYAFSGGKAVGYRNLFAMPWSSFMADDSPFFINGVLHLRAELTVKQPGRQQARQH